MKSARESKDKVFEGSLGICVGQEKSEKHQNWGNWE